MTQRLPHARPPSLAWRLAYTRLVLARLLELVNRENGSSLFALVAVVAGCLAVGTFRADPVPGEPVGAIADWIVMIIVMVVSALVSYAMRPKPKDPAIIEAKAPVAEDGKGIVRIYGPVWIDDSVMLGFKQMGTIPIKKKSK